MFRIGVYFFLVFGLFSRVFAEDISFICQYPSVYVNERDKIGRQTDKYKLKPLKNIEITYNTNENTLIHSGMGAELNTNTRIYKCNDEKENNLQCRGEDKDGQSLFIEINRITLKSRFVGTFENKYELIRTRSKEGYCKIRNRAF